LERFGVQKIGEWIANSQPKSLSKSRSPHVGLITFTLLPIGMAQLVFPTEYELFLSEFSF